MPQFNSEQHTELTPPRSEIGTVQSLGAGPTLRGDSTSRHGTDGTADAVVPQIPGYAMLELLGQGGMGVVYKARDIRLGRYVAIKMVASGPIFTEKLRDRFQAEARAVALLQHPHIAQVYVADTMENRPYFVMEFVNGGPLSRKIAGQPQPPKEAADLIAKLAEAIDFSHRKGVVHRDLKPGNVLLHVENCEPAAASDELEAAADGFSQDAPLSALNPKVADFGLAKFLDSDSSSTKTGDILGTPSYMAPEQAGGVVKNIGPACDIYSLGAILYELLTGRPPFRTPDPMQTVLMVLSEEPVPPRKLQPTVPRDLETICLKCLEKQPAKRYATAGELAADLQRFLADEPILARPVGRWERGVKWAKRRPAWATLIAVCLLSMLGSVAAAVWHNQQMKVEIANTAQQRDRANEEKDRAERLFQNGHRLAKFLASTHYRALEELSGGRRVREGLSQELIGYLDRLSKDTTDDTVLLEDLANAYEQIAFAQGNPYGENRGDKQAALKNYGKALKLRTRLIQARPKDLLPRLQRELCREQIADIHFQMGRIDDARKEYNDVLRRTEALRREFPRDTRVLAELIHVMGRLGDVDETEAKLESALKRYLKALELAGTFPPSTPQKRRVHDRIRFDQHHRLGQILEKLSRVDEAETHYRKAYELAEAEMKRDPESVFSRVNLSLTMNALGDIKTRRGKWSEARDDYQAALKIRRRLAREAPHSDLSQENLAITLERLGIAWQSDPGLKPAERIKRAVPFLEDALKIRKAIADRNPNDIERIKNLGLSQRQLADALIRSPQQDRAETLFRNCLETADRLQRLQKGSPQAMQLRGETLYQLGIIEFAKGEQLFLKHDYKVAETHYRKSLALLSHSARLWDDYHRRFPSTPQTTALQRTAKKLKTYIETAVKERLKRAAEKRKV